jgi:hypothetical protein
VPSNIAAPALSDPLSSTHPDIGFDHPLRSCGRPILGSPMLNQIGSDKWKLKITSAGAVEVKNFTAARSA